MQQSAYAGACVILTTKHAKSIAVAPSFWEKLQASVVEYVVDTDTLGTFSGEIARAGNALECARKKCDWALQRLGDKVEFALANEGSFGPHPYIPFSPCDHEILYFMDKRHDFELSVTHLSERTNYRMQAIDTLEALEEFANCVNFPSHALILRPSNRDHSSPIFKGVDSPDALDYAFRECMRYANDKKVWVETDMRAQFNPTRMSVISELAAKLTKQLATHCPSCAAPGWGKIKHESGLPCIGCGLATEQIKQEIYGCVKCQHQEIHGRPDGLEFAEQLYCQFCNP